MKKMIAIVLAVLMLAGLATVAFATDGVDSPGGETKFKISITLHYGGNTKELPVEVSKGGSYTVNAPAVAGYVFSYMTLEGDYTRAGRKSETLYTPTATLSNILSEIKVDIYYELGSGSDVLLGQNEEPTPETPAGPVDEGATSPDTGLNFALIALVAVMGVCGVVASKKVFEK